ncbi:GIY-YIG nuclease family protein [Actinomadura sp. 21ATH]|uniref:GIY-YIG nuclease family protein n=1 Tax=Actinomadura sp. 21ATH TaxID=1735444 RepID=UPI0035BFCD20
MQRTLGRERSLKGGSVTNDWAAPGEATLTEWMHEHAQVCWIEHPEPWTVESALMTELDLSLNLDQNRHNAFHARLTALRAEGAPASTGVAHRQVSGPDGESGSGRPPTAARSPAYRLTSAGPPDVSGGPRGHNGA